MPEYMLDVDAYVERFQTELARVDKAQVRRWADLVYEAWKQARFVYVFGNGGSACNATHICEDLAKGTIRDEDQTNESFRRLKIMSLTDNVGWILAVGNDWGYDQIFLQQLMTFGKPGDLAVAISGSGRSPNVLRAVDWAKRHGLATLGLTGFDGGELRQMVRHSVHVPADDMGMVESIHQCLHHWVLDDVHARINRVGRYAPEASDS